MITKTFKIPVTWAMSGYVLISQCETLAEAIETFDNIKDVVPLPTESYYVEDSFQRDSIMECEIANDL